MRSVSGFYRPTLRYSVPTKFRARCFLKCCVLPMGFASIGPLASRRRPPHPVLVHRLAPLLHASFRPHLAVTPLRFANPSPPAGWVEDFHLQAVEHARHTNAYPALTRWATIVTPFRLRIERKTNKTPTQAKEAWVGHPAPGFDVMRLEKPKSPIQAKEA